MSKTPVCGSGFADFNRSTSGNSAAFSATRLRSACFFGLPLDIRHIAFSSAYVGYSVAALDFTLPWQTVTFALAGVLLIGLVNLTVSFSLTLTVATRARCISFAQGRTLGHLLPRRFLKRPQDFLLPPLRGTAPEARPATSESSTSPSPPPPAPNASQPLGPDAPNG
ncbi:hypothetical protein [Thauera sinica]|uniref:Uncharacterized protein n=1 Tax=Thauera sinica TaxID=2665146 RepID=A0ABW1AL89_9RHOO